jgi:hypothetical protein
MNAERVCNTSSTGNVCNENLPLRPPATTPSASSEAAALPFKSDSSSAIAAMGPVRGAVTRISSPSSGGDETELSLSRESSGSTRFALPGRVVSIAVNNSCM